MIEMMQQSKCLSGLIYPSPAQRDAVAVFSVLENLQDDMVRPLIFHPQRRYGVICISEEQCACGPRTAKLFLVVYVDSLTVVSFLALFLHNLSPFHLDLPLLFLAVYSLQCHPPLSCQTTD